MLASKKHNELTLSPLRITVLYLTCSAIWVAGTDYLLFLWSPGAEIAEQVQVVKGAIFIAGSSLLLWYLISKSQKKLQASRQQLRTLIQNASVGLIRFTEASILEFNQEFSELTGFYETDRMPRKIGHLVHPGDRERFNRLFDALKSGRKRNSEAELRIKNSKGGYLRVFISLARLRNQFSTRSHTTYLAAMHDITEHRQYESYTKLLFEIVITIDPARNFEEALRRTIQQICQKIEWDFGEAWIPGSDGKSLERSISWHRDEERLRLFEEESRKTSFAQGTVVPGLTWTSSRPVWMEDTSTNDSFVRKNLAQRAGLKSAMAIPIKVKGELVAILVLLKSTREERNDELLRFLEAVGSDIGNKLERKREYEARVKSEENLQNALDAARMATWSIDLPSGVIDRSDNHHLLYGQDHPESRWDINTFLKHVHPEYRQKAWENYQKAVRGEDRYNLEYRAMMPDGSVKWLWTRGEVHLDQNGEADRIDGVVTDIDQRKKAELQLNVYRERLERAQEIAQLGYWERNFEKNRLIWSDRVYEMFRLDPDTFDLTYESFMERVHEDDYAAFKEAQKKAHRNGYTFDFIYRFYRGDGTIGYFHDRGKITEWKDGEAVVFSGAIMDITELKWTEQELEKSRQLTDAIFDTANIGICVTDTEARFTRLNRHFCEMVGYNEEALLGQSAAVLVSTKDKARLYKAYDKVLDGDSDYQREWELYTKEGDKLEVLVSSARLPERYGDHVQVTTVLDITEIQQMEFELRKNRQLTDSILETADIGICVTDEHGRFSRVNREYCDIFGYREDELLGEPVQKILPGEGGMDFLEFYKQKLDAENYHYPGFWKGMRKDGEIIDIMVSASNLVTADGERRFVTTVLDVTEQKDTERQLRASENKYRMLFRNNPQPMWIYDPDTFDFVEVNDATVRQYGYSREEFAEMKLLDILPDRSAKRFEENVDNYRGKFSHTSGWIHICKDGTERIVDIIADDLDDDNNNYRLVLVHDITDKVKAEKRTLRAMVKGEDRERRRIARELHDGLGQYLTAAQYNLSAVEKKAAGLDEKPQDQLKMGLGFIRRALDESRSIAHNLMPKTIEDYGLIASLETLVKQYRDATNIEIEFYPNIDESRLPKQMAINLYRIAQEVLNNTLRHAEANYLALQILMHENELIFTIEDDGKGFKKQEISRNGGNGLGLQSIQTRAKSMSAALSIDTSPGRGTSITLEVPLEPKEVL